MCSTATGKQPPKRHHAYVGARLSCATGLECVLCPPFGLKKTTTTKKTFQFIFVSTCVLFCARVPVRVECSIAEVASDLDAAGRHPGQEHKAISKVKQKARAFLQEMVANISPAFIRYVPNIRHTLGRSCSRARLRTLRAPCHYATLH